MSPIGRSVALLAISQSVPWPAIKTSLAPVLQPDPPRGHYKPMRPAPTPNLTRRVAALAMAGLVAGCASAPVRDGLPSVHYATGLSRGGVAAAIVGRPSMARLKQAEIDWRLAIGQAMACRMPATEVARTSLAGAVELGAMSA